MKNTDTDVDISKYRTDNLPFQCIYINTQSPLIIPNSKSFLEF
jgi:hypothetical protein